jgi:pyrroloquinoline quinone biosynthesis protein B
MRVKVLGSAAGGGFPQWNCGCSNCVLRAGELNGNARTQAQLAFSVDSKTWFLLNASPDLRAQILATSELTPPEGSRRSPLAGIFLTSADVDSVMGLLHLREFATFRVFATPAVQRILQEENTIFRVLDRAVPPVQWTDLSPQWQSVPQGVGDSGGDLPFRFSAVPLSGRYPDYVNDTLRSELSAGEAVVGLLVEHGKKRLFFAPSLLGHTHEWKAVAQSSDLVFLDGTFWSDDELIRTAGSDKTARAIGHLPLSGTDGLLRQFSDAGRSRRVLIHINNTNPILDENTAEYRHVREMGWEIAHDGMEFEL